MIELYTPLEIIEKAVQIIETERKVQKLQQKELALKAIYLCLLISSSSILTKYLLKILSNFLLL
jgi:hypothetical protein